jgi:hypothetical protein
MTSVRRIQGIVGLAVLGWAFGCGSSNSSGGGSANFSALYTQYTAPTGKLAKTDLGGVGKAFTADQTQKSIPVGGASLAPGRLTSQGGLKAQGITETESCTDGGNFAIDIGSIVVANSEEAATITYNSCSYSPGESVSGTLSFAEWSSPKEVFIYDGSLTVTDGSMTDTVNLDYALINGTISWSVDVASGNVLVSESGDWNIANDTGTLTITDSQGTWNCTWTTTQATCTGPGGTITAAL